ncbi:hypothetical protein D3C87_696670 [compost metagenome]
MKRSPLVFALVAGTLALTACVPTHQSALGPDVVSSQFSGTNTFDLKSPDKGVIAMGLASSRSGQGTQAMRYVQFVGEVRSYLVKLVCNGQTVGPANGFSVEVNPDGTGKGKATFFNLPKGSYDIYVTAIDQYGVILNKSGGPDQRASGLAVGSHAMAEQPASLECAIQLRDDHVNLPSSLIEKTFSAVATLIPHLGAPMQTPLTPKRSPELIPVVTTGPNPSLVKDTTPSFDDETSFSLSDADIEALSLPSIPPYMAFITDENGANGQFLGTDLGFFTTRNVSHVANNSDPNAPSRLMRIDIPGVGTRNMYFTDSPNNVLKAASGFYNNVGFTNVPPSYMRLDPELVSTTELFFSARYPTGIVAKRYIIVDVDSKNWNIWTLNEGGITMVIGMAMPYVQGGVTKILHLQLLPSTPLAP